MSDFISVQEALDLLDRLRQSVIETAAARDQIAQESRNQGLRERRTLDNETNKLQEGLAAELTRTDHDARDARLRIETFRVARQKRIERATKTSLHQRLKEIEAREGRQKFHLQKGLLETNKTREAEKAQAEQMHESFQTALTEAYPSLAALERQAQVAFRGYRALLQPASVTPPDPESDPDADENQILERLKALIHETEQQIRRCRWRPLPLLFRYLPVPVLTLILVVLDVGVGFFRPQLGLANLSLYHLGGSLVICLGLAWGLYFLGRARTRPAARSVSTALVRAQQLYEAAYAASEHRRQEELSAAEHRWTERTDELTREWNQLETDMAQARESTRTQQQEKAARVAARHASVAAGRLEQASQHGRQVRGQLESATETQKGQLMQDHRARQDQLQTERDTRWTEVVRTWEQETTPVYEAIAVAQAQADSRFPLWTSGFAQAWQPPEAFVPAVRFGRLEVDLEAFCEVSFQADGFVMPGLSKLTVPLLLTFPRQGSLLIETSQSGHDAAVSLLNTTLLRLLATSPTSRLNFTLLDPVGLGQSFAGITHLADYGDNLLQGRIWTQAGQIEQQLADLNEHMEKVIQVYLRNEYETIAEYNAKAGKIAEKYHFLVLADFPVNFTDTAIKRLLSIAASGPRCGVYTLIHWDRRQSPPQEFVSDDLRQNSVCLNHDADGFVLPERFQRGVRLVLDEPPAPDEVTAFIQRVGEDSLRTNRVEVPFEQVVPGPQALWSEDTTVELRIPIGLTGATKRQCLALGQGTRQHALIAGKTGSGKSTLFHVIITNLALWCHPDQVEFYLVDFKKGVEFQCYAKKQLPHARVVAIESDREFGLSVLQRIDQELKRRGELFRKLGAQDLAGYKKAGGTEPLPRSLLIIDEFQEFFVEDDRLAQNAALLLDRFVRQGRAFGIHVLLGSQTLGGAYTLARTTIGQMVIRVALQCNEADAYMIMDDTNPAPRLLSRPGEGIYNDTGGTLEGNSPFQTVWLSDEVRDRYLDQVRELAARMPTAYPRPIVFDGNAPADVEENAPFAEALGTVPDKVPVHGRIWLGAPNSIKGPTEAVFRRQSGSNLLLVGQREEATLALMTLGVAALAAQYPAGLARLFFLDSHPPDSAERALLERLTQAVPHDTTLAKGNSIEEAVKGLGQEMKTRGEAADPAGPPPIFVFIHGLQRLKKLRYEDDFSYSSDDGGGDADPGKVLNDLICEGPSLGIHTIALCDTFNNVNRFLSRKALSEFEMRILFQMSANDSASLIDSPKAGALGLHRALFYSEQEGHLETFRPYALPPDAWWAKATQSLRQRKG